MSYTLSKKKLLIVDSHLCIPYLYCTHLLRLTYSKVSMHSTLVVVWQHRLVAEPELPQENAPH